MLTRNKVLRYAVLIALLMRKPLLRNAMEVNKSLEVAMIGDDKW